MSRVVLDHRLASIARHSFGSAVELDERARTPSRQQSMNLHKNPGLASLQSASLFISFARWSPKVTTVRPHRYSAYPRATSDLAMLGKDYRVSPTADSMFFSNPPAGMPIQLDDLMDDDESTVSSQKPDILDDPFAWLADVCGYTAPRDSALPSKLDEGFLRMTSSREELLQGLWQSAHFHRQEARQAREELSQERMIVANARQLVRTRVKYHADQRVGRDRHERDENHYKCTICYLDDIDTLILGCGHVFCGDCLDKWKTLSHICPGCRKHVKKTQRLFIS